MRMKKSVCYAQAPEWRLALPGDPPEKFAGPCQFLTAAGKQTIPVFACKSGHASATERRISFAGDTATEDRRNLTDILHETLQLTGQNRLVSVGKGLIGL